VAIGDDDPDEVARLLRRFAASAPYAAAPGEEESRGRVAEALGLRDAPRRPARRGLLATALERPLPAAILASLAANAAAAMAAPAWYRAVAAALGF